MTRMPRTPNAARAPKPRMEIYGNLKILREVLPVIGDDPRRLDQHFRNVDLRLRRLDVLLVERIYRNRQVETRLLYPGWRHDSRRNVHRFVLGMGDRKNTTVQYCRRQTNRPQDINPCRNRATHQPTRSRHGA